MDYLKTFREKPHLAITLVIALVAGGLFLYSHRQDKQEVTMNQQIEESDFNLGPLSERGGGSLAQLFDNDVLGTSQEALVNGCSLRFSYAPTTKIIAPGSTITYNAVVRNGGLEPCTNTSFSIYYSSDEKFVGSTPAPSASNYYWAIGTLGSNQEARVTFKTQALNNTGLTQIHNDACATAHNANADACAENVILIQDGAVTVPSDPTPTPTPTGSGIAVPQGKELGMWIWTSPVQMSREYSIASLDRLKKDNFNVVYVTIDDYLTIHSMKAGKQKDAKKKAYFAALSSFVRLANERGIAVDVEGGDKTWAIPTNRWKGFALIDFVKEYNIANPNSKVRGFQYDVEPYLLPNYESDKATVLTQFVQFIDQSTERMKGTDATFTVVIPHFYDSLNKWTPTISYGGRNTYAFTHLLNILEKKPGSSIILMSYRNFFNGSNGTKEISQAEVIEASNGNYSTRVIVAQETGNVEPDFVTFYGLTRADLLQNMSMIYTGFSSFKNFGGGAVHYIDPFFKMI